MMSINPYAMLAETISPLAIQGFILAMLALIVIGTVVQMIHHKNVTYFFNNAKKAKLAAERELGVGEKTSVILKTVVHDIATTAELGAGKRRIAHVMGMYGTILFWVASVVLVFGYTGTGTSVSTIWPMIWHVGAIMTCVGGYWFWLFLRVDVLAEAHPWYRIIKADSVRSCTSCMRNYWTCLVLFSIFRINWIRIFIFSFIYYLKHCFIWGSLLVKICTHDL